VYDFMLIIIIIKIAHMPALSVYTSSIQNTEQKYSSDNLSSYSPDKTIMNAQMLSTEVDRVVLDTDRPK